MNALVPGAFGFGMARRLKVYSARLGFFESVVAAPNQDAALDAWGVHQDLFAAGEARVVEGEPARAALKHPGVPLKRAVGSDGPFSLDARPPEPPAGARTDKADKPPPSRARLDAAEARLERIEDERAQGEADFYRRREALEAEEAAARKHWAEACKEATQDVQRERRAYQKAGGRH
ncbi:MAG TPA: hypothetical protein VGG29_13585 [Caulobacteraceae bacterium]